MLYFLYKINNYLKTRNKIYNILIKKYVKRISIAKSFFAIKSEI